MGQAKTAARKRKAMRRGRQMRMRNVPWLKS
jgi:hypothetical protein